MDGIKELWAFLVDDPGRGQGVMMFSLDEGRPMAAVELNRDGAARMAKYLGALAAQHGARLYHFTNVVEVDPHTLDPRTLTDAVMLDEGNVKKCLNPPPTTERPPQPRAQAAPEDK